MTTMERIAAMERGHTDVLKVLGEQSRALDRIAARQREFTEETRLHFQQVETRLDRVEQGTDRIYAFLTRKFGEAEV